LAWPSATAREQAVAIAQLLRLAHDGAHDHEHHQHAQRRARLQRHAIAERDEARSRRREGHHGERNLAQQRLAQAVVARAGVARGLPTRGAPAQQQREQREDEAHRRARLHAAIEECQVPRQPQRPVAGQSAHQRQRRGRRTLAQVQLDDQAGGRGREQQDRVGGECRELQRGLPRDVRQVQRQREGQHGQRAAHDVQQRRCPRRARHRVVRHRGETEDEARTQQQEQQVGKPGKRVPAGELQRIPRELARGQQRQSEGETTPHASQGRVRDVRGTAGDPGGRAEGERPVEAVELPCPVGGRVQRGERPGGDHDQADRHQHLRRPCLTECGAALHGALELHLPSILVACFVALMPPEPRRALHRRAGPEGKCLTPVQPPAAGAGRNSA